MSDLTDSERAAELGFTVVESRLTRQEHLEWCKERAREYLDRGDWQDAFGSFVSDMGKHPDTKDHLALGLGMQLLLIGKLRDVVSMREFIEGFH